MYLKFVRWKHLMVRRREISIRPSVSQRPHHTLLHQDYDRDAPSTTTGRWSPARSCSPLAAMSEPLTLHSHLSNYQGRQSHILLMTFQVLVTTPESTTMQALALLDLLSLMSFVTECLAQHLWLPCSHWWVQIAGIGGTLHNPSLHTFVSFAVSGLNHKGDTVESIPTNSGE